ncbi:MAG TPA: hypothetical protein VEX62_01380 [Candidatus Limnocylindrales bacterium]|nr:hypothetical protein [Candidatus Limnocylindrales bacterium]
MTEGDRPTNDPSPVNGVSDDTDVYPIDFLPPVPPARAAAQAQIPPQPYPAAPPGSSSPNTSYGQPGSQPPPGYVPSVGYDQRYSGYPPSPYPGYQGYAPHPGYRPNERAGTGRGLKLVVVVLFVLLVGLVGLIFGLATGILRYNDLARLIGMGPGEIYVQNLRDDLVTVTLQQADGQGDASTPMHEDQIGPADVRAYPERASGGWDIRFLGADGRVLGACELTMSGNGRYTFMVLPDVVVVSSAAHPATSGDDYVTQASPLCRRS